MTAVRQAITRGKRILKIVLGKDVWTRREIDVPAVRLGSNYGGWMICTTAGLGTNSIVYTVGVGEDLSFDKAMIEEFNCDIVAFDPTPKSIAWVKTQNLPDKLHFYPWGLAGFDGKMSFAEPEISGHVSYSAHKKSELVVQCDVHRLTTIMGRMNHGHVDLLKMDIEGSEYDVIQDIQRSSVRPRQLLVEFHHEMYDGLTTAMTRDALARLKAIGYKIFAISASGREYSLLTS